MNKYLWWHNIFHLFLSHCFMKGSSIVKGRIPFVWSHRWRSFQSHLSFYFLTVPPLCCVPFSPQIAHWPACIYSANATRFVTTATCYNPPPSTLPPQENNYFFIFATTCRLSDSTLQPKYAVILLYGCTLKCQSKWERLLDSIRGV